MRLVRGLEALSNGANRLVLAFCVGCVLAMLTISFVGFFYMAFTGSALSWTYSLARLFIPWIGMLSITVAFKSGEHVAMSLLPRGVPATVALALRYASVSLIGVFALLLIWFGWEFVVTSTQYYMVSDQIQIHGRWVAACVPATGAILIIHLINGRALLEPPETDTADESGPAHMER